MQAILVGVVYYLGSAPWAIGYLTMNRPLVAGTVVGIILGNPIMGVTIGATIQLIYLGWMSVGGAQPSDPALAGTLGTALAVASNLDIGAALALAVPLGMLGTLVWFGRNTFNTLIMRLAKKPTDNADIKGIWRVNVLAPQPVLLMMTLLPVSLAAYYGPGFVQSALEFLGDQVLRSMILIGGVLPAVGIALNLKVIMKRSIAPFFFLGFFLVSYLNMSMIGVSAFAACAAALYYLGSNPGKTEKAPETVENEAGQDNTESSSIITKKDLLYAWFKWFIFSHCCINYERFENLGWTNSISHILAKLYKTKEELSEALERHQEFFNTEPYIGIVIMGITAAMEEQKVKNETVTGEAITAVKTGLMGPLAGIGDTLNQAIVYPVLLAFCASLVLQNNLGLIGPVLFIVLNVGFMAIQSIYFINYGYRFGKEAVTKILKGGAMDRIITAAGILGCGVLGALSATYVYLSTALTYSSGETAISLQTDLLDTLMPKLLPLGVTLLCLALLKKSISPTKIMLILAAAVIVLGLIGII